MKGNKETFLSNTIKAVPGYEFFRDMCYFIRNPDILDGEWESTPLKTAGKNLVKSLFLVGTVVAILNMLFKEFDIIDFPRVINPVYLTLTLAVRAVFFGVVYWMFAMMVTCFRTKGIHSLYFMQVIQTYSVINFLIVFLFWFCMNRVIVTGDLKLPVSEGELWLGGGLGLAIILMCWRLLINPTARYLARYYSFRMSWVLTLLVVFTTIFVNSYVHLGFNNYLVNDYEFCEYIYKSKYELIGFDESQKSCFIGNCLEIMKK
ncbi:hypothetical protein [Brenneria goodwinii]|uniref:hypothetical protein n=1 Tax=Brenneria goodwinii TaxID=1109412 RepID=UPI0036E515A4